jgi:nucleotide-binding universal stress UspA family protein
MGMHDREAHNKLPHLPTARKPLQPISKILVAIDGSDKSTEASQYAILLAKKNRAKLLALNVINTQPWFYSSTPYGWATPEKMEDVHKRDKEEAQIWLDRIKEDTTNNDVEIHTKILLVPTTGSSTVNAIVSYAEENDVDPIVVGTRGRTGLRKMLLGSVASGIVTYSHCPVLVIK